MARRGGASSGFEAGVVLGARDKVRQALVEFQAGFFCLGILPEMVEEIRILSLNAELAAGRAGAAAAPIRVATQNTRGIVNQLVAITDRMNRARYRSYRYGALAMRGLPRLARFGRTADAIRALDAPFGGSGVSALEKAQQERGREVASEVAGLIAGGEELRSLAQALGSLVQQSGAIASSMTILATAVPNHQAEFMTVADAMKRLIVDLRERSGQALKHVDAGLVACSALREFSNRCSMLDQEAA